MPAPNAIQQIQEFPLKIVGGNNFGRFPKISNEQTWNMIVSDNFLVPYAGYKAVLPFGGSAIGRGLYASTIGNFMLAVIGSAVVRINSVVNNHRTISTIPTSLGDVYMAENNNKEILITDGSYAYIYDYDEDTFYSSAPGVTNALTFDYPASGQCAFQDGRFIVAINGTQTWALSALNVGTSWPGTAQFEGAIQSKPGFIRGVFPMPGGGNNIIIMGATVSESWQDVGTALFPYQRNSTFNIDYGCLNPASVAYLENFVVWLAVNEQSGPIILYTQGGGIKTISTDGISFKLSELSDPTNCTGFLFKQDGHLIYQFTFPDDNLTFAYDFNTSLFFTITDEDLDYHPARQVVFFNNDYYFVSLKGGDIYRFGTQFTDAEYRDGVTRIIPRLRVTPPVRFPSQRYFICKSLGFTIENGDQNPVTTTVVIPGHNGDELATEAGLLLTTEGGDVITNEADAGDSVTFLTYSAAVDLSISRDGGVSFGSSLRLNMNDTGKRKSRFIYQRLGIANDVTFQLRFSGFKRFVCTDGELEVYQ